MAIYNDRAQYTYSLNDGSVSGGILDLLVVNAFQRTQLQELGAEELEKRIVVQQDKPKGFVVFRALLPSEAERAAMDVFMAAIECADFDLSDIEPITTVEKDEDG